MRPALRSARRLDLPRSSSFNGILAAIASVLLVIASACTATDDPATEAPVRDAPARSGTATVPPGHLGSTSERPDAEVPFVVAFDVEPSISCVGEVQIDLPVSWETARATSVALLVDGEQVGALEAPTGSTSVPLMCDGRGHVIVLSAIGTDGRTAVESRAVATSTTRAGD